MLEKDPEDRIGAQEALDVLRNFTGCEVDLIVTDFKLPTLPANASKI